MPQSPSQTDQLSPGTVLAQRFRIEQHIGSGGYASVYRAIDLKMRTERAIKEVTDTDAGVRRQFELEAGLLINSEHPNIPPGYQLFEERGRLYLVMEFVRGRDLEDLLNESLTQHRRPLDEAQVLRWAIEVCGALEVMHEREVPIIHRDIKPANIKITPKNKPILIDFGLAKLQTGGPTRTAAQGVSPGFAPPEQYMARGRTDARTDIYGLGATLYACLTGKDPPEAPSRLLAQTGATGQALISPKQLAKDADISDATDRAVVKSLELSPGSRYETARSFKDDLTIALRRLSGAPTGAQVAEAAAPLPTVMCQRCGQQTRADLPRCQNCGVPVRVAGIASVHAPGNGSSGKRPAVRPLDSGKVAAMSPARPTPLGAPPLSATAFAAPSTSKQPAMPATTGKQSIVASPPTKQPASASGKQPVVAPPALREVPPVVAGQRTGGPLAAVGGRSLMPGPAQDERATRAATGVQPSAVMGALALAPAQVPPLAPRARRAAAGNRSGVRAAADVGIMTPARPRSWLNLGGPELSSLGKSALAISAIETCWGVLLLALASVEVVARNSASKPYFYLAVGWFGVVLLASVIGAQILGRPVSRRGRVTRRRRAVQGFGLAVYALAVHGIAIWGVAVFTVSRPDAPLAIAAFVLFAVNVFAAGVLSLANTLG